jgi:glycosyl transferase family 2
MDGWNRHVELNGGAPLGWQAITPSRLSLVPDSTKELPTLYAIISTWYDADIIEASIKNCFTQGASKVFILDNASPDNTVEVAIKARGILAKCYETKMYDEDLRIRLQNEIIKEESEKAGIGDLWWMVLDADEFPTTLDGKPVIESLRLDNSIRLIGTDFIDLYPSEYDTEEYIPGKHPATVMSHAVWRRGNTRTNRSCSHWKHSIIRLFNGIQDIAHSRGNHTVTNYHAPTANAGAAMNTRRIISTTIAEPEFDLFMFHAPYRNRTTASRRLEALCGNGRNAWDDQVTKNQGAIRRWKSLEDVYEHRWDQVVMAHTQIYGREIRGLALYPWRTLVPSLKEHNFV